MRKQTLGKMLDCQTTCSVNWCGNSLGSLAKEAFLSFSKKICSGFSKHFFEFQSFRKCYTKNIS